MKFVVVGVATTKIKMQQEGLVGVVKQEDRPVSHHDGPVGPTGGTEMGVALSLQTPYQHL